MGYTKRQYIEAALTEIGLADYVFNSTPQDLQTALRRLDGMMAEWNERGIRLGYPLPLSPQQSDLDSQTAVPDRANEAIVTNLACRIAPSYGKQVSDGHARVIYDDHCPDILPQRRADVNIKIADF